MNAREIESEVAPRVLVRAVRGGFLWVLLGYSADGSTYTCGECFLQRFTLKTPGAVLPNMCPKCGAK